MTTTPSLDDWMGAVRASHDRLVGAVGAMTDADVAGPSYATEWSIAQVLSHLGSGAEIFSLVLQSGLQGAPAPGMEAFQPIWDRWNAKTPPVQAADALAADRAFLGQLEGLSEVERRQWTVNMFGGDQGLEEDLLRLRLGEHALHTWDVTVVGDPKATLAPDAAELLVDVLDQLVSRVGRSPAATFRLTITTADPLRTFLLAATADGVTLQRADGQGAEAERVLHLPAEALIRLVYGRLDAQHAPTVDDGADLEALRTMFPGF